MNWLPGVSQLKSVFQLVTGDPEGALQTQKDFCKQCPLVSQVTSVAQVLAGDTDGAIETQKQCLGTVNNSLNSIPVVGHAKSLVHLALNDKAGAKNAFKASTRTSAVLAAGAGGFITGGPVGAAATGIYAGVAMDSIYSFVEGKCNGIYATMAAIKNNEHKGGSIFDLVAGIAFDGFSGYNAGQVYSNIINQKQLQPTIDAARKNAFALQEEAFANMESLSTGEYLAKMNEAQAQFNYAQKLEGYTVSYTKSGMQVNKGEQSITQVGVVCYDSNNKNDDNNNNNNNNNENNNYYSKENDNNNKNNQNNNNNSKESDNNNNNNNENNNNNSKKSDNKDVLIDWIREILKSFVDQNLIEQLVSWINGFESVSDHDLSRLKSVLEPMVNISKNTLGYIQKALLFVLAMSPGKVSDVCSYLRVFEAYFLEKKGYLLQKETKRIAAQKAIDSINTEDLKQYYNRILSIVRDNNMVYTENNNLIVEEIGSDDELIDFVRRNAQGIRFGSEQSAVYHLVIHPVIPLEAYILNARQLITNGNATVKIRNGNIEIEFTQVNGNKCSTCSVLIFQDTKSVILATYNPRKTL